jgi:hypothetical protein
VAENFNDSHPHLDCGIIAIFIIAMKTPIFVSALLGWAAAALLLIGGALLLSEVALDGSLWVMMLTYTGWSGIIAVPTCLTAGALVNKFLPFSSPWWAPKYAALFGGIAGGLVIVLLMASITSGEFEYRAEHLLQGIFGAVPGSVCGFSLARFKQKLHKLEAPKVLR